MRENVACTRQHEYFMLSTRRFNFPFRQNQFVSVTVLHSKFILFRMHKSHVNGSNILTHYEQHEFRAQFRPSIGDPKMSSAEIFICPKNVFLKSCIHCFSTCQRDLNFLFFCSSTRCIFFVYFLLKYRLNGAGQFLLLGIDALLFFCNEFLFYLFLHWK